MKTLFSTSTFAIIALLSCTARADLVTLDLDGFGTQTTFFDDVAASADGVAFTFDVTITSDDPITFGGSGPANDGPIIRFGQASSADFLTFTLSDIQPTGGTVSFDDWSGGSRFDGGDPDNWLIAGQTITGGSGAFTIATPVTSTALTIASIDNSPESNANTRVTSLDLNFTGVTAVPEPSSALLLVAGGIGIVFRRRRKAR